MKNFVSILAILLGVSVSAQSHGLDHGGAINVDTTHIENVKDFFSRGKVNGHIRYYFMSTVNQGDLTDYYANAAGGAIRYESASWLGFKVGIGGNFIYNIGSSDLEAHDSLSNRGSRFERQLFDFTNPEEKYDLDRLEELYINYTNPTLSVIFGKHSIYSPLVNPQDGRMKPYLVEGLWVDYFPSKKWIFHGGLITKVSPRSTISWYRVEDAIGIYGQGVNVDGNPSNYKGNISSKGLAVGGVEYVDDKLVFQFWNYYLDNIVNAAFTQIEYKMGASFAGLQYLREDAVGHGGSDIEDQSYYPADQSTNLLSFRLGRRIKGFTLSANYTHIFDSGRFLFPREFGREQFFTTISRGRMEGMGGAQTLMFKGIWVPQSLPELSIEVDAGRTWTPGAANTALNKYVIDSYDQFNLDIQYQFKGIWNGLVMRFLYVHNRLLPGGYTDPALIHNRHNYHHFNLITNIYF